MEILDKIIYRYLSKKNHPSIAVFVDDCVGLNVICHEVYEKQDIDLILKSLNREVFNYTCLDIGANIGNHSIYFSKYFKNVISYEPQDLVYKILKINTSKINNIQVFNFALSDEKSDIILNFDIKNRGGASFVNKTNKPNGEVCKTKIFDEISPKLDYGFIKIDVEGFEIKVLKGMEKSILKNQPIIAFEGMGSMTDKIIDYLKDLGYDKFLIPSDYQIHKIRKPYFNNHKIYY